MSFQVKLDSLIEDVANISSHVASIEDEWPKFKQNTADIAILRNETIRVSRIVADIQSKMQSNAQPRQQQPIGIEKLFNESNKINEANADKLKV